MFVTRTGIYWRNGGGIGWEGVALIVLIAGVAFATADRWWVGFAVLAFIPFVIAMAALEKAAGIPLPSERYDAARYRKALQEIAAQDAVENALDPQWAARIAAAALDETHSPTEEDRR